MSARYVITGTDTDVGKTIVAAGLTQAFGAHYWKPIQAGLDPETDSETVARLSGAEPGRILPEAYRLATPCSPHRAASLDGLAIEPTRLALPKVAGPLIVEGAGGVMVPVNDDILMIDLFRWWDLPVILVACTTLGTINHSLLSITALRGRGIRVAGIVFVGGPNRSSERAIVERGSVQHLGRLPWDNRMDRERLALSVRDNIRTDRLA